MDQFGSGVPVAFLLHKYQDAGILRGFLDNLAIMASQSARPSSFPGPCPRITGVSLHQAAPSSGAASATTPSLIQCCPAYCVVDLSVTEKCALEAAAWYEGWQGDGHPAAEFPLRLVWCNWHLGQAWKREAVARVHNPKVRARLITALGELQTNSIQVCAGATLRCHTIEQCHTTVPHYCAHDLPTPQDARLVDPILDGFVTMWTNETPEFIAYFNKNYVEAFNSDLWIRKVYLARYPPALWHRIPTGTQHGESAFSHIKGIDFKL